MQVCVAGEQNGVTPPQSPSPRHPAQVPPPVAVSQRGLSAEQREVSAVVQAAQTPFGRQIGASAPHSAADEQPRQVDFVASQTDLLPVHAELAPAAHWTHAPVVEQTGSDAGQSGEAAQARQVWAVVSQIGFVPLQSAFDAQPTHAPLPTSQSEAAPLHEVLLVAEQAPHAPEGWHAGAAPPHSPSIAQPRQLCAVASQTGLSAGQSASFAQAMQSPTVASQIGIAPVQEEVLTAEHWPHAPLGSQAGVAPPHWVSFVQAVHAWAVVSQTGFVAPHWVFVAHVLQIPSVVLHAEVGPVQDDELVAEHTPHAPLGWQAGVAPPHWASVVQPLHV